MDPTRGVVDVHRTITRTSYGCRPGFEEPRNAKIRNARTRKWRSQNCSVYRPSKFTLNQFVDNLGKQLGINSIAVLVYLAFYLETVS